MSGPTLIRRRRDHTRALMRRGAQATLQAAGYERTPDEDRPAQLSVPARVDQRLTGHTPGPWRVQREDDGRVLIVYDVEADPETPTTCVIAEICPSSDATADADARLIARATHLEPLADALEELLRELTRGYTRLPKTPDRKKLIERGLDALAAYR